MKVGIIGGGTVGRATARCYLEFVEEVRVYDALPTRSTRSHKDVLDCDLVFVCLPEQELETYFAGLSGEERMERAWVIRSTVPIGTCHYFHYNHCVKNLAHSPEFLTARCAEVDAKIPSQLVVGGPNNLAVHRLRTLYGKRFAGTPIRLMSWEESEFLKLALNSFFAVKVAWFNEIEEYCRHTNLDYEKVRQGILGDGRVTAHHTLVPGPDGFKGFGGACLPKDLIHLIDCMSCANLPAPVCMAAHCRNLKDRLRDYDP